MMALREDDGNNFSKLASMQGDSRTFYQSSVYCDPPPTVINPLPFRIREYWRCRPTNQILKTRFYICPTEKQGELVGNWDIIEIR